MVCIGSGHECCFPNCDDGLRSTISQKISSKKNRAPSIEVILGRACFLAKGVRKSVTTIIHLRSEADVGKGPSKCISTHCKGRDMRVLIVLHASKAAIFGVGILDVCVCSG